MDDNTDPAGVADSLNLFLGGGYGTRTHYNNPKQMRTGLGVQIKVSRFAEVIASLFKKPSLASRLHVSGTTVAL